MKKIAKYLLEIEAVKLSPTKPFTWASGLKSPIYCDNRLTISYPVIRTAIARGLAEIIKSKFPEVEAIGGVATAGIPHAAWVADLLDLPLFYVRSKPKNHGRGKQIEGAINSGTKVILIDDLLSTGGSVLKAVDAAKKEKLDVIGVGAIFSYQLDELTRNFKKYNLEFDTVTNYSELIEAALEMEKISPAQLEVLKTWRNNPEKWSKTF
ncbi:MAG TPA: orotate phosphoribosyltransferase [Candidatus Ligilactobacillus excrementigallinarum]|uniref:Orotate phosphoribosyltransferase n=1 Tax=Candidatus Ligilactobacillus excrementigallinarum TaxID=2838641 RepID=A0A9D1UXW8_9LACO|nr:orotate phosphoribosyltransferase [Candidatus Ligilactobacillus excrementigallinarum]